MLSFTLRSTVQALLCAGLAGMAGLAAAAEAGRVVYASGPVHMGVRPVAVGDAVQEGDELATGRQGFVYVRTVDGGLLVLRPESRARVVDYKVDNVNPANTRVKLELLSGVARSVSGEAVKKARQNFRFNTPVAAIGVRGTDFTVYTDEQTSRVTVLSGAIVVSGFVGDCMPGGSGPCEHGASRELAAGQAGQMLQVQRGQEAPQLMQANGLRPDAVSPPKSDEPVAKSGSSSAVLPPTGELVLDPKKTVDLRQLTDNRGSEGLVTGPAIPPVVEPPPPPPEVAWGRWKAVLDNPATISTAQLIASGAEVIGRNNFYTLYRLAGARAALPTEGSIGFALQGGEAVVQNERTAALSMAGIENGKLNVNFDQSNFTTSFDLVVGAERIGRRAEGTLGRDGSFVGKGQFTYPSNMNVTGVVTGGTAPTAAYIFSTRLDDQRVSSGITQWGKLQ
ncbi:FecR domain-containing protein [Massilia sp. YMA4]|uniref:FecR family protein n=1 Tax=Massilia sp. YMA4 TaxID=1593482 RepID=UPI000DD10672|nr:FecR family protein [Massilia sp. YMA4]AXA94092.1 hypothetical protein DPH57_24930 [Massilia sp. YMA4]